MVILLESNEVEWITIISLLLQELPGSVQSIILELHLLFDGLDHTPDLSFILEVYVLDLDVLDAEAWRLIRIRYVLGHLS